MGYEHSGASISGLYKQHSLNAELVKTMRYGVGASTHFILKVLQLHSVARFMMADLYTIP